jgi:hypothetical protein
MLVFIRSFRHDAGASPKQSAWPAIAAANFGSNVASSLLIGSHHPCRPLLSFIREEQRGADAVPSAEPPAFATLGSA